jgi:hypothetical protein
MITTPTRRAWTTASFSTWLLHLLCVSLCVASSNADEVDAKVNEINETLRKSRVEAAAKALADMRVVAADLVEKGDPRKDQVLARVDELARELDEPLAPDQMRELVKAFERVEDRGGWWWIDEQNPEKRGPWYRLDRKKKRFVHYFKDANGKPAVAEMVSATYEILGVADEDNNIILIRMTGPPKGAKPGDQSILRFDRKTGVLQSSYGWHGIPKNGQ